MIEISNLAFSYGSNDVLRNISMKLEEGRIYGLLGENGVGKTTLLTLLCGLKRPRDLSSILVDGVEPYKRLPSLLQNQYYLPDEPVSVYDTADAWARSTGVFWPNYSHDKFTELMKIFEVNPSDRMNTMSTGQLKKTNIAFALALGTKYLFLDEPTNGLDIPGKAQFRSAIMKYTLEDSTIVISTHQVRDLENIIDPIVILDKKDVLVNASLEEIGSVLYFDYGTILNPDALYTEQLPGGFIQVYPNATGEESKVNIEALFNTVHKHKDIVKGLLKK